MRPFSLCGLPDHQQFGNPEEVKPGRSDRKSLVTEDFPQALSLRKEPEAFGNVAVYSMVAVKQYPPQSPPDFQEPVFQPLRKSGMRFREIKKSRCAARL